VFTFLLVLMILDGFLLGVVVLLQAGKGGGLAAMGGGAGTETFIGGRQAATILTKATWITGGVFLALALVLSILSSRARRPDESILQREFREVPAAPAQPRPILPGTQPAPTDQEGGAPASPGQAAPAQQAPAQ